MLFIYVTSFPRLYWIVGTTESHNYVSNSNICMLSPPVDVVDLQPSAKFPFTGASRRAVSTMLLNKSVSTETASVPPGSSVSCQMVLSAGHFHPYTPSERKLRDELR